MSTPDYLNRGVHSLTTKLALTTLNQNLTDPVTQAINDHAAILDAAAIIVPAPISATAPGKLGQIATDGSFLYIATGTNQWKRIAIASW